MPDEDVTAHIAVKMPVFTRANPRLFFKRAEAQFGIANVKDEVKQFFYVFTTLPDDIAVLCQAEHTDSAPYTALKKEILALWDQPKIAHLNEVFGTMSQCDDKPSILQCRIKESFKDAGIAFTDEAVIHKIMQALPNDTAKLLIAHSHSNLATFLTVADTVWAAMRYRATPESPTAAPVDAVSTAAAEEEPGVRPFQPGQRPKVCRAHIYYGLEARTCRAWCQFPGPIDLSLLQHRHDRSLSHGLSPIPSSLGYHSQHTTHSYLPDSNPTSTRRYSSSSGRSLSPLSLRQSRSPSRSRRARSPSLWSGQPRSQSPRHFDGSGNASAASTYRPSEQQQHDERRW